MLTIADREEALRDDYHLESSYFADGDEEEDEWNEDEGLNAEGEQGGDTGDVKDESTAYLEFLNDEVRRPCSGFDTFRGVDAAYPSDG